MTYTIKHKDTDATYGNVVADSYTQAYKAAEKLLNMDAVTMAEQRLKMVRV